MRMSSWLQSPRSLLVPSGTENGHHPTRLRKRAMAAPLSVERLEDRTVPSTFTVGNLADSGPESLRQAVLDANANPGADLIRFAPSARDGTVVLTSGELSITDDLQIDGPGADRLAISGNDASRVFSVSGGATDVEIRDLTIANGRATGTTVVGPIGPVTLGGALLNTGARVVLFHVTMANNQAVGPIAQGGAIANVFGATLEVTHGTFTGNRAAGTMFGSAGAILNEGGGSVLVLDHSTFTGNQATASLGAGPVINQGNAVGGAVKNSAGGQATVLHTTFEGNLARGGNGADGAPGQKGGDAGFGVAGALENAYYGIVGPSASSTMTVAHSSFLSNRALGGTGGAGAAGGNGRGGVGGAISNAGSTLTISHSTFLGNQSLGGRGGNGGVGGNGGAAGFGSAGAINSGNPVGGVRVFATLHVSDCLFQGNVATAGAGGSGGSGGNGGDGQGGAISNGSSTLTVSHSTFLGNQVLGGNGGNGGDGGKGGNGGNGSGGAISNAAGSAGVTFRATLHVSDSLFQGNKAIGGAGGNGGSAGNGGAGGAGLGGGLRNQFTDWDVRDSLFVLNQATGGAGGDRGIGGLLSGAGGAGQGGGLINLIGSIGTLSDSTVILNTATGGAGGVGGNGGNGQGGGVFNGGPSPLGTPSLTLRRSLVALNRADGGAAGDGGSAGLGQGGGLYLTPGGVACADPWTFIFANDASTSDDDVFGDLGDC